MSLLCRQLKALFPQQDFTEAIAGPWLQQGATNATYREVVAALVQELTVVGPQGSKIRVSPHTANKGRTAANNKTAVPEASSAASAAAAAEITPEFVRDFYFRSLSTLVKNNGGFMHYPLLVGDVFGCDSIGELLDVLCAAGDACTADTIELRREVVRFLVAEATALRLTYRNEREKEESAGAKKEEDVSAAPPAVDNKAGSAASSSSFDDARFVLCLLQELSPVTTSVAELQKVSAALIASLKAAGDAAAKAGGAPPLTPIFGGQYAAVTPEHRKAMGAIHAVLVDEYTLRWATQLERMQCTLRAFADVEGELADGAANSSAPKGGAAKSGRPVKGGGAASPSCAAMSRASFESMNKVLQHASGILERVFDHPRLSLDGDLFPLKGKDGPATMCVGMVNAAFAPISLFRRKTNFTKRNQPLVPVPDRGGRTNVSNFERAVSSSSRQKDHMMRQGSGGGGGRGGGRGGGGGGGNRHADPNKSADQVRSGGGNWSGRGGARGGK